MVQEKKALQYACDGTVGFHLSFDIDFIDPSLERAVGTPVAGGATEKIAMMVVELARESGKMISMDMVEVNPILDKEMGGHTVPLAVRLIVAALKCS